MNIFKTWVSVSSKVRVISMKVSSIHESNMHTEELQSLIRPSHLRNNLIYPDSFFKAAVLDWAGGYELPKISSLFFKSSMSLSFHPGWLIHLCYHSCSNEPIIFFWSTCQENTTKIGFCHGAAFPSF